MEWDINLKTYEKESFLKIFFIFSSILAVLTLVIALLYYQQKKSFLNQSLLSQMREYNFNFKGKKFDATIVKKRPDYNTDKLYINTKEVYSLFKISKKSKNLLKIIYPKTRYDKDLFEIKKSIVLWYLLGLLVIVLLSVFYAYYALYPMKKALHLIEDFLRDVIHDINTPVTTILLNCSSLKKRADIQEIKWIEISAKKILSLYKNFEIEIKGFTLNRYKVDIYSLVLERVDYFKELYPRIEFNIKGDTTFWSIDKEAFVRVIDNIISNSCKYSKSKNAKIYISIENEKISIADNGIGIKNPERVYDRFYKENERGLGIGMNIVKKLCDSMGISILISSKKDIGTTVELTLK